MRQFDVCRLKRSDQLVVLLQHDVADELGTRVVAPLSDRPFRKLMSHLRVAVLIEARPYVVQLDRLAAIANNEIGPPLLNLAAHERPIKNGLDLLFLGI